MRDGNRDIHIGQDIRRKLKEQGRTVTWFANEIHTDRSNVYKMFQQHSMDVAKLMEISRLLDYNFLQNCADKV